MAATHLATYLNDHLAGSVIALEMLESLEKMRTGTPVAAFAAWLRAEVAEDRQEHLVPVTPPPKEQASSRNDRHGARAGRARGGEERGPPCAPGRRSLGLATASCPRGCGCRSMPSFHR